MMWYVHYQFIKWGEDCREQWDGNNPSLLPMLVMVYDVWHIDHGSVGTVI